MKSKKKPARARRMSAEEPSLRSIGKSVLLALPITAAIAVLLMLPATALLLTTKNPNAYHGVVGSILLYLTAILGGTLATRLHRRRMPLFCGLAMGAALLLLLLVLSLILPGSPNKYNTALRVGLHALLFPATVLGAFLGAKEPRRRRRTR